MAKSVKKSDAAPKSVAKPRKFAVNNPAESKSAVKEAAGTQPSANKSLAKKPVASANGTNGSITHDQVALLAHRFFEERGHTHGHDEEDWFRAEQDLRSRAS